MPGERRLLMALEMRFFAGELLSSRSGENIRSGLGAEVKCELLRRTFLPGLTQASIRRPLRVSSVGSPWRLTKLSFPTDYRFFCERS